MGASDREREMLLLQVEDRQGDSIAVEWQRMKDSEK